ncbi:MAG: hypothetical protein M3Z36_04345 [Acidobacteriota bacterium]|nr:hypothetical protein [Acidobacteriota bacterium]
MTPAQPQQIKPAIGRRAYCYIRCPQGIESGLKVSYRERRRIGADGDHRGGFEKSATQHALDPLPEIAVTL